MLAVFDLMPNVADGAVGSLRHAINQANSNLQDDVINLAAGTYSITISGIGDELNLQGDFDLVESGFDVTIRGQGIGVTTINGGQLDRVFDVFATATLILEDLTIRGGRLIGPDDNSDGGALRATGDVHLRRVEVTNNQGHAGGGLLNDGRMTIVDSIIRNNTSQVHGGGIKTYGPLTIENSLLSNNSGVLRGGGLEVDGAVGVEIRNTTISGNTAGGGTGGGINNYGGMVTITASTLSGNTAGTAGGIAEEGGISTLINVTVSGNTATLSGGGMYINGGESTLFNSTISGNTAGQGGGVYNYGGLLRPRNSIFSGNTAADGPDIHGTVKGLGFNLVGNTTRTRFHRDDLGNNLLNVNPMLGPLQDNGGETQTHALMEGSPAIDAGTFSNAPPTDQRGTERPQGVAIDLGSFEVESSPDIEPPTMTIAPLVPNPRTFPVTLVEFSFSEPVTGLDVADFTLTRNGSMVNLVGLGATISSFSPQQFGLDLSPAGVANLDGQYQLTLTAASSGITDLAGNPLSAGGNISWLFDGTRPTADIVDVTPDPRTTPVGLVTINFTEPVAGVTLSDFTLRRDGTTINLGALGVALTTVSPSSYQLNLSGPGVSDQDGNYVLTLNASGSGIADATGNLLSADASDSWTLDVHPPTADILDVTPDPRTTAVPAVVVTFSEAVTGVDLRDFTLTRNGQAVNLQALGATLGQLNPSLYTITLGLPGISDQPGTYVLTLHAATSGISDLFGNPLSADASDSWVLDSGNPTADIVDVTPDPRTTSVAAVTVQFSEPVTGVTLNDFTLTRNGTGLDLSASGATLTAQSASVYVLNLASATAMDGTYVLTLRAAGSGIQDQVGAPLLVDASDSWSKDSAAPTADIDDVLPDPRNTSVGLVSIRFSEAVSGVGIEDFSLTRNGSPINLQAGGAFLVTTSASHYLLELLSLASQDGSYVLTLNASGSGIVDLSGLALIGNASDSWTIDTTPPSGDIVDVTPDPRSTTVSSVIVQFSEPVTGLGLNDFTLTRNGVGLNLASGGATLVALNPLHYQLNLNQLSATAGSYVLVLNQNGVQDQVGNPLTSSPSDSWTIDLTPPTVDIVDVTPDPRTTPLSTVTVTFSEAVTGVDLSDFRLTRNAQPVDLAALGATVVPVSAEQYQLNVSAAGIANLDGTYQLTVVAAGSAIRDLAGNNLSADASDSWTMDVTRPEATIAAVVPSPRNTPVNSIAINFSEPISGFQLADLRLTRNGNTFNWNGSGASLAALSGSQYELRLASSTVNSMDGIFVLTLNAAGSGIVDSAGNLLLADASTLWSLDQTLPTGTMSTVSPDPRIDPVGQIMVFFSEPVSGVDVGDFRLTLDGTPVDLTAAGVELRQIRSSQYELNFASNELTQGDGDYLLTLVASNSGINDLVGNPLSADVTRGWTIDLTPPTAVIGQIVPDPRVAPPTQVTFDFSEPVINVDLADFTLTFNGNPINLAAGGALLTSVSPSQYVLDLSALDLTDTNGQYRLSLVASGSQIEDLLGNEMVMGVSRLWAFDEIQPTLSVRPVAPDPRNTSVGAIVFRASETLIELDPGDFTLTRDGETIDLVAAGVTIVLSGPNEYMMVFPAGSIEDDGEYLLTLIAAETDVTDVAGNPLASDIFESWTQDSVAPTADIVNVTPDPHAGPVPFVTIQFSEPVTGVHLQDFQLKRDSQVVDLIALGAVLTQVAPDRYQLNLSQPGLGDIEGHYELTLDTVEGGIADPAGNPLDPVPVSDQWEVIIVNSPLTVLSVGVNTAEVDPPDLPHGPQLTSWSQQRSEIRSITIVFSQPMLIQASDLVLTNLGVDADNAPDIVMPLAPSQLSVAGTELTLRFGPNQLTDGVYQLEILPTATNLSGVPLDGDGDGFGGDAFVYRGNEVNAFYRLQVDWHPDGGASIFDFPVFRYWFGIKDRPLPAYVDLNGDGGVSIFDFPRIVANFGRAIVFPSGLAAASGAESEPPLADQPEDESMLVEPVAPSRLWAPAWVSVPKRPTAAADVDRSLQVESALDDIALDIALQWNDR